MDSDVVFQFVERAEEKELFCTRKEQRKGVLEIFECKKTYTAKSLYSELIFDYFENLKFVCQYFNAWLDYRHTCSINKYVLLNKSIRK